MSHTFVPDEVGICFTCGKHKDEHQFSVIPLSNGRVVANEPPEITWEADWAQPARKVPVLDDIASRYTPVDWELAWTAQPLAVEWLFEPLLERGTVNALFAKPGTGKSLLALEVALSLVRRGHAVVYVDDENRLADLVERLQAFGATAAELKPLKLYSFAGLPALDTPVGGEHLQAISKDAQLVILDTTTRMVAGRENDADTFLQLYRCSLAPLKGQGVTVLRLDHPGKDEDRGQRGSSAKDGDVDTIWKLTEVTRGLEYRMRREKNRSGHGDNEEFKLARCYEPLRHEWTPMEDSRSAAETARVAEILLALERAGLPPETGRPTAREALRRAGVSAPNRLVETALRLRKTAHGQPTGSAGSSAQGPLPARTAHIGAGSGQAPAP